jgi:hypothetical protein
MTKTSYRQGKTNLGVRMLRRVLRIPPRRASTATSMLLSRTEIDNKQFVKIGTTCMFTTTARAGNKAPQTCKKSGVRNKES